MSFISNPRKTDEVRKLADRLTTEAGSANQLMEAITVLLNREMLKYNWVGFYMLGSGRPIPPCWCLDIIQGAMTPHTGFLWTRASAARRPSSGKTVVVDDV